MRIPRIVDSIVALILALLTLTGAAPSGMVDIKTVAPGVVVDVRYATPDNFLGRAFYTDPTCYLTPATAAKVAHAEAAVSKQGYHLLLWDCARPLSYQYDMWNSCVRNHGESHCSGLVANPYASPSGHTYGNVIDVGLVTADGSPVELPSKYDSGLFSEDTSADKTRSRPPSDGVTKPPLWSDTAWEHYRVLRSVLSAAGFTGITSEWWHWKASA